MNTTSHTLKIVVNKIEVSIVIPEDKMVRVKNTLYTFSEGVYYCRVYYYRYEEYNESYYEMKDGEWHRTDSPLVRQSFAHPYEIAIEIN